MKRILTGIVVGLFGVVILGGTANAAVTPVKADRKAVVIERKTGTDLNVERKTRTPLEKERSETNEKER